MSMRVPTQNVFGLGEHYHTTMRREFNNTLYPLFTQDHVPVADMNLYGHQPYTGHS